MKNKLLFSTPSYNRSAALLKIKPLVFYIFILGLLSSNISNAQVTIFNDNFETGTGNWNLGADTARLNNNLIGGGWTVRLRNGNGAASSITSNGVDLTSYGQINLRFRFRIQGYEPGERLFLQYSSGGGFTDNIAIYTVGSGINNNTTYTANITMTATDFAMGPTARFRIRGFGNQNNDQAFIDDINITGYTIPPNDECTNAIVLTPNTSCENIVGTTQGASESLPGCSGTADDDVWYSFVATDTEHTVKVAGSARNIAFEVFDGSCGGASLSCQNANNNNLPEETTFTTLTIGNTYYVRVYTVSNNPRFNGEFSICIIEPCIISTANGTSALSCPSVDAGGVGLSGSDVIINCSVGETTLEAEYLDLGETSSYAVDAIPYSPPFQFNCLENPVSVNIDDNWSPIVNLPFDFCFFGSTYNSCVIGSNGVISFNTGLANSYSGWVITDDIPSAANSDAGSFGASIFGAHHDVDPSVGGEIGYQLITLDSGCQALVAAWSDVPMYNDNSKLYTGMMVFYEDTNVIEVYIKEKQVVSNWNGGNATIGLQENATNGISPPGRNSLSTNWTATNEAWRFTPNGASITELKWYENSISAANEIIDPDDDGQITVSPNETTNYVAEVTYNLCNGTTRIETDITTVTVTGKKTWNGSVNNNWNVDNNWTPVGIPDITNCVTIPVTARNPRIPSNFDANGYNLEILDGADLLQRSNSSLTIDDIVIVQPTGRLRLRDDASLIQINDVVSNENIGSAEVRRRVDGVDYFDYVYWSAPVENFNILDISPGTPNFAIYNWNPTVANGTTGQHGTWTNTTENMTPGKGYIVRGLLGGPVADQAQFEGILNNGQISYPISRGTYTAADYAGIGNTATAEDDNWNLLGNPYPSAIALTDFVAANPTIDGTLYFWRHLTPTSSAIDDPFYEDYVYNYSPNDYLTANGTGSTPAGFNGFISSGQGFFALMLDSASSPNSVSFSNSMRGTYANDGFYRGTAAATNEKHRIWLDLVDQNNLAISILVGFVDGATTELDRLFDGVSINDSSTQFYSVLADKKLSIQAKGLPFNDTEIFPLGYVSPNSGSYTISINNLDGLFTESEQDIYLEDTELNIIHNLRTSPYTFVSNQGTFNERFNIKFNSEVLSTTDNTILTEVSIRSIRDSITVKSPLSAIKSFELFDVTGRVIHKNANIDDNDYNYETRNLSKGTYIVKVSLINGGSVSKKLII